MESRWGDARALETPYRGHRFRSRLEARWAVFMDALEVEWEYEPEGFDLRAYDEPDVPVGFYLPDFWLPYQRVWFEVKPDRASATPLIDFRRCDALALATGFPAVLAAGPLNPMDVEQAAGWYTASPVALPHGRFRDLGAQWAVCLECGIYRGLAGNAALSFLCGHTAPGTTPELSAAYTAARGRRFGRA